MKIPTNRYPAPWGDWDFHLIKRLKHKHYIFTLKAPLQVCINRDKKRKKPLGYCAATVVYNKTCEFDYGIIIKTHKLDVNGTLREILAKLPAVEPRIKNKKRVFV